MKKALSRLFVGFCLVALSITLVPFHIAYAEQYYPFSIDNVLGVNVYYKYDLEFSGANNTTSAPAYTNTFSIVLDNDYIGEISFHIQYALSNAQSTLLTMDKKVYVNGHIAEIDLNTTNAYVVNDVSKVKVLSINSSQVIAKNNMDFPFESYTPVAYAMNNLYYSSMLGLFEWTYPTFFVEHDLTYGAIIFEGYVQENVENYFIFGISQLINTNSQGNRYIDIYTKTSNSNDHYQCTIQSMDYVTSATYLVSDGSIRFYWFKVKYKVNTAGYLKIAICNQNDFYYVPIYHANSTLDNISTDFALRFGLSNKLLKSLENLSGTASSDASASDLATENNQFSQDSENLFDYEDNFNADMNSSLNNINVNFDVGNQLGSKFLASATWVRQQFDALTSTSPFGTVLSFSLILGIALLLIGKAIR